MPEDTKAEAKKAAELPTLEEHAANLSVDPALFAAAQTYYCAKSRTDDKVKPWPAGLRMTEDAFKRALKSFDESVKFGEEAPPEPAKPEKG